jgi:hypothetical protein
LLAIGVRPRYGPAPMLVCATCSSRWDEHSGPAARSAEADCPLCGGELILHDRAPLDAPEPVHGDVARVLREHLLGVGA